MVTLINYLVGLLISLQVGTICKQGEPVDWAHWTKTHPYAETVAEARFDGEFEFWLIDGDCRAKQPSDKDGLVLVRQSHTRTEHAPADIPALLAVYREDAGEALAWVAGESVLVGTRRTDAGKTWEALQAHVTQSDWRPSLTPALWREVVEAPPTAEWTVGVAYKIGDEVTYQGATYRCLQAHTSITTWFPTAPGILNVLWQAVA